MTDLKGRFFDGKTAKSQAVSLLWHYDGVELLDGDENGLLIWPLADIRLKKQLVKTGEQRFFSLSDMQAELVIEDDWIVRQLSQRCPDLHKKLPGESGAWKPYLYWGSGAIASVIVIFWIVIPALSQQIAQMLPGTMLATIGEKAEGHLVDFFSNQKKGKNIRCENAAGQAALDRLANQLLVANGQTENTYQISVLNHKMANAFTLPGGRILIMKGLLELVDHPNGVAGVIAHEIAHAERRHPAGKMISAAGTTAILSVLLGDVTGGTVIAGIGQAVLGAAYGRDKERESDAIAISLMEKNRFDLMPMIDLYIELDANTPLPDMAAMNLLSTHPGMKERLDMIRNGKKGAEIALNATQWSDLKNICH